MTPLDELTERLAKAIGAVEINGGMSTVRCWFDDAGAVKIARAVLAEIHAAGVRLVPSVPTEEMMRAILDSSRSNGSPLSKGFADAWLAAVAASPYQAPKG